MASSEPHKQAEHMAAPTNLRPESCPFTDPQASTPTIPARTSGGSPQLIAICNDRDLVPGRNFRKSAKNPSIFALQEKFSPRGTACGPGPMLAIAFSPLPPCRTHLPGPGQHVAGASSHTSSYWSLRLHSPGHDVLVGAVRCV